MVMQRCTYRPASRPDPEGAEDLDLSEISRTSGMTFASANSLFERRAARATP
jgi:hypothetical protein